MASELMRSLPRSPWLTPPPKRLVGVAGIPGVGVEGVGRILVHRVPGVIIARVAALTATPDCPAEEAGHAGHGAEATKEGPPLDRPRLDILFLDPRGLARLIHDSSAG